MAWVHRKLSDIGDLACHLCRAKIGDDEAGLIQVNPGPKANVTTGLYHDKCWEKLKEDKQKLDEANGKH